jgi:alkylation response protein AidB-like acyl-CoA dehydrogenase
LEGEKVAVPFPLDAEVHVVVARDDDGLIAFVMDDAGDNIAFHGADERKLAMAAVPMARASIVGLRIGDEAVLGRLALSRALSVCRLAQASVSIGASEATTRYAADWGTRRVAFGRPLVGFQGVSFVLANLLMDIEAARLGVYDALGRAQASEDELEAVTSHLVAHVNRLVGDAGREGVELMGVHGVIADHPAERIFRSAAVLAAIDFDPLTHPLTLR